MEISSERGIFEWLYEFPKSSAYCNKSSVMVELPPHSTQIPLSPVPRNRPDTLFVKLEAIFSITSKRRPFSILRSSRLSKLVSVLEVKLIRDESGNYQLPPGCAVYSTLKGADLRSEKDFTAHKSRVAEAGTVTLLKEVS